ncbi:MAG: hypothetical protein IKP29_08710 [Pseudobutyrivibrio sp.]|nr:hypothetical protein [Pseudobutyrivibrio sp.]
MSKEKELEAMYGRFMSYQQELHEKNGKKIRVGLKVNIFLPLIFLILSFMTKSSKLVFLVLWIVSLFGISFYLLYIEFTDFKLQEKMKEFGVVDEEEEQMALIGAEVQKSIEELKDIAKTEMMQDIRDLKKEIREELKNKGGNKNDEEHS